MNVDKRAKPWLCAAKQEGRFHITEPWLEGDELRATDGRMAVRIKVLRVEGDTDGFVSKDALQAAAKAAVRSMASEIACNGALDVRNGPTFPRRKDDTRFPDVAGVEPKGEPIGKVTLDAELLVKMQQALGAKAVTLEFYADEPPLAGWTVEQPMRVLPIGGVDGHGLLMPLTA